MKKPDHWFKRELRELAVMARDPTTWVMTLVVFASAGLVLWFLLLAADNFGAYYSMPYACSAKFTQLRLFFLTILAPLFFVAVFVTMAELGLVLGLRKKNHKANMKFLLFALVSMLTLGAVCFHLLSCGT